MSTLNEPSTISPNPNVAPTAAPPNPLIPTWKVSNPSGSNLEIGLFPAYRYRLASEPDNRNGSSEVNRPSAGSYCLALIEISSAVDAAPVSPENTNGLSICPDDSSRSP